MPNTVPIVAVEPHSDAFVSLLSRLEGLPHAQVAECRTLQEGVQMVRQLGFCVLLCYAGDLARGKELIQVLRLLQKEVTEKKVRMLIILGHSDDELLAKFDHYGASEVLPEPITERVLLHKVEHHLKALAQIGAASTSVDSQQELIGRLREQQLRKKLIGKKKQPVFANAGYKWVTALSLESDCWLCMTDVPQKIDGKWHLKMKGPHSSLGEWLELKSTDIAERIWLWVPKDPANDPYVREEGGWIFKGLRPECATQYGKDIWSFCGRKPELSFLREGHSFGSKLSMDDDGVLLIAKDSPHAFVTVKINEEQEKRLSSADTLVELAKVQRMEELERKREREKTGPYVRHLPPLAIESDCWLLANREPTFLNGMWNVWLLGPGPRYGAWRKIEPSQDPIMSKAEKTNPLFKDSGESSEPALVNQGLWEWVPSYRSADPFTKEGGRWVFSGEEPILVDRCWEFKGTELSLRFEFAGARAEKLGSEAGVVLRLAGDSVTATSYLDLILESLEERSENSFDDSTSGFPEGSGEENSELRQDLQQFGDTSMMVLPGTSKPLGLISMAFIASELCVHGGIELREVCSRYCSYLGSSCGNARAEIWILFKGRWINVGTSDNTGGVLIPHQFSDGSDSSCKTERIPLHEEGLNPTGPIASAALVLKGDAVPGVEASFLTNALRMSFGMLTSLADRAFLIKSSATKARDSREPREPKAG